MRFKLISYNIWHGKHLDQVVEFLREEQADVLCLQEVATEGVGMEAQDLNIFSELKSVLNLQGEFKQTFAVETGGGRYNLGVAVLSKHSLEKIDTVEYAGGNKTFKSDEDWKFSWPSAILTADVSMGGSRVKIATTHLPVTRETAVTQRQLRAAAEVKGFVKQFDEIVFCGDMNTLPGSETYQILAEGLEDVTDPEAQTLHPTIHPVGHLGYHVDYVFYKSERLRHIRTKIPVVDGSDHLPVVVEFEIGPTKKLENH